MEDWQVVEAFLIPLIVSVLVRSGWSDVYKAVTMFIVCIIAAVINQYVKGELVLTFSNLGIGFTDAIRLVAIAIPLYYGWYKPSNISPTIERFTG